ncbi:MULTISPECIES: preprotein translocase subunit YajC [Gudongella]|jgi:preprotein translocase subunit YajC|uniref:preprotein translocase subunit YajC n=1 Tax=Gudongella oleilytica TaxID=1582259 RepID=UPI000FF891B9|nr:preprotein translocase subunit YajC [Gudongella oleilytica]MDY0256920.1 preprotein translocase subunit YajC [Gudongella oleilytica]HMM70366.1 preprotein translocase subunit YajC [Gudongella oleilytica]
MEQLQAFILPIGLLVIFYFFAIRPQKKKEKEIKEMRSSLRVGDEVITIGGIMGKIIKLKDDYVTLEIGSAKTKLDITRWAVGSVVKANGSKSNKQEEETTEE